MVAGSQKKEEIEIPENIKAEVKDGQISIEGRLGKLSRKIDSKKIDVRIEKNKIVILPKRDRKKFRATAGTMKSHISNMIRGVESGWEYKLKIIYSHFPITVKVEKNKIFVHNFIGERLPRTTDVAGSAKLEVKGDEILVKGIDLEEVGRTAANIENVTKIKKYDRRIFQDGIYIVKGKK